MEMVRLDPPAELTMPIGEAMFSQRATRRLDPDRPITDKQLKIILDAASKAPNGGNAQPARFLVIRDREAIKKFGKLYHEAWWAKRRDAYGWKGKEDIPESSQYRWAALLADEMEDAPCVIWPIRPPPALPPRQPSPAYKTCCSRRVRSVSAAY